MSGTDEDTIGIPTGSFRCFDFGGIGHIPTDTYRIDQADNCTAFSGFESNGTDRGSC